MKNFPNFELGLGWELEAKYRKSNLLYYNTRYIFLNFELHIILFRLKIQWLITKTHLSRR